MNRSGPIVVIEDDLDDQFLFETVYKRLGFDNELLFFADPEEALAQLRKKDMYPFLIMSDVNMPKLSGFELRKEIHTDQQLQTRCIPYLFFTTAANQKSVLEAYSMSIQGFFVKDVSMEELEKTLGVILNYWKRCLAPNTV